MTKTQKQIQINCICVFFFFFIFTFTFTLAQRKTALYFETWCIQNLQYILVYGKNVITSWHLVSRFLLENNICSKFWHCETQGWFNYIMVRRNGNEMALDGFKLVDIAGVDLQYSLKSWIQIRRFYLYNNFFYTWSSRMIQLVTKVSNMSEANTHCRVSELVKFLHNLSCNPSNLRNWLMWWKLVQHV